MAKAETIRGLERGLRVMQTLQAHPISSLHDIHIATGISKPSLLRILHTLEQFGMVSRRLADGHYRISAFSGAARKRDRYDRVAEAARELRVRNDMDYGVEIFAAPDLLNFAARLLDGVLDRDPYDRKGYRKAQNMAIIGEEFVDNRRGDLGFARTGSAVLVDRADLLVGRKLVEEFVDPPEHGILFTVQADFRIAECVTGRFIGEM